MNHVLGRISVGLLSLVALVVMSSSGAQAQGCTSANVAGDYGFTLTGSVVTPGGNISVAAVGRAKVEASGHVTGTEARSVGGDYADETFSGLLTVNSDCSGSITLDFFESGAPVRTSILSLVFDENRQELRMVQKSFTLPNGAVLPVIITVQAARIHTD